MENWLYSKSKIIENLETKGIKLTKARGQNFLLDKNILKKMVSYIDYSNIDNVIEIGPGIGSLTEFLIDPKRNYYLVELDRKLFNIIKENYLHYNNVHIFNKDFLKFDLEKQIKQGNTLLVSNIPYNLTSKIIERGFIYKNYIKEMYLLMQKEVAHRIISCEGNKTYGSLSIFVKSFSDVEILFNVSRNVFFPVPKVDSSFVRFKLKTNNDINIIKYGYFLKRIFSFRRKRIENILSKYILNRYNKEIVRNQLKNDLSIDSNKRPEEITYDKFIEMFKFYYEDIEYPI
jgi:16S rRNA (adenine1518-N6/adenine1519-N6)-dimethyltransferase